MAGMLLFSPLARLGRFSRGDALAPADAIPPTIVAHLGQRQVILESGAHGLKYFPDECPAFVQTAPTVRLLMAAGVSSWLLGGRDMKSLVPVAEVLKPGGPGSFDNGYAGICGAVPDAATGKLLAFYHAEDHEGMPPIPGGIPGFYCRIGLAVSGDQGASFDKRGPIITSSLPKDLKGRPDQGCGDCCVTTDAEHRFLYVFYCDHSRVDHRGVQICLARCPVEETARTDRWAKFHGNKFDEPGLGGKETPVLSAQAMGGDALFPQVTYLPHLHRYVMVFNIAVYRELNGQSAFKQSGIYISCSPDALHWSPPTQLLAINSLAAIGKEVAWHPALVISTLGRDSGNGWLYYSYSESWGHKPPNKPHYLVGQPITFSIGAELDAQP
jgi:hypothetical protein